MTRAVEDALAVIDEVRRHHEERGNINRSDHLAGARATLAAHIAAQDLTVQHLEGSCEVLRERIAAQDAEIARLREALNLCAVCAALEAK